MDATMVSAFIELLELYSQQRQCLAKAGYWEIHNSVEISVQVCINRS